MKSVLITGAGSGLGRGTAIGLAKAGHRVFATTQLWAQATDLRREVETLGLSDTLVVDKLDVLDERDVTNAMRWPFDTFLSNAYDTGFNDRLADTTYHWHDDAIHLTKERDIRASFAPLLKGQLDPQEMIDKMVEVVGADEGLYRNVWPPAIETLIRQIQERAWTLPMPPT
jgi:NAD(P)-dependent dehydrogenase (short-subunit alcohol dehydrogenase family)